MKVNVITFGAPRWHNEAEATIALLRKREHWQFDQRKFWHRGPRLMQPANLGAYFLIAWTPKFFLFRLRSHWDRHGRVPTAEEWTKYVDIELEIGMEKAAIICDPDAKNAAGETPRRMDAIALLRHLVRTEGEEVSWTRLDPYLHAFGDIRNRRLSDASTAHFSNVP